MDPSRLLRTTIVVEHTTQDGPPDGMGDPTELTTWSTFLGYVWQASEFEQTAGGQIERETWNLALRREAAGQIDSGDRVVVDGRLDPDGALLPGGEAFDVSGPPFTARNPRTLRVEYVQARLERSR